MNVKSLKTSLTSAAHSEPTAEAIAHRAYELWEQEGRPDNRDLHHWLRAEQELLAEQPTPDTGSPVLTPARPENIDTPLRSGPGSGKPEARDPRALAKRSDPVAPMTGDRSGSPRSGPTGPRSSGRN